MQSKDISFNLATTEPQTEEEKLHYSLNGNLKNAISGTSNFMQILLGSLDFVALSLLVNKGISFIPYSLFWSGLIAFFFLLYSHNLLKVSYQNYLTKKFILKYRPSDAQKFKIEKLGFPILPTVIALLMFGLSIFGAMQMYDNFVAYEAKEITTNTEDLDEIKTEFENSKSATKLDIEQKYNAEERANVSNLKSEISRLEMKLTRIKASQKANDRKSILREIEGKRNEIENIKAKLRAEKQKEISISNLSYNAKIDSVTKKKEERIKKTDFLNDQEKEKEKASQNKGVPISVFLPLIVLITFFIAQYKLKELDVKSGIFDLHHYGTIQKYQGLGVWINVIKALITEHNTKAALNLYNRFTVTEIQNADTSFLTDSNSSETVTENQEQSQTAVITDETAILIENNSSEALLILPKFNADISNYKSGNGVKSTVLNRLIKAETKLLKLKTAGLNEKTLKKVNNALQRKKEVLNE